ncbi:hypothetical protein ANN_19871 [Periplaneta americana]|uniref:Uncharacterized protein n=1 Tax=Periplaneta americana TaxID=6978 RepID=A0ABQ8SB23_PERAM|nr:hypothetical protein ANN_19871 [Periplaneta americana]
MAGLCEGGNEPSGSLKAILRIVDDMKIIHNPDSTNRKVKFPIAIGTTEPTIAMIHGSIGSIVVGFVSTMFVGSVGLLIVRSVSLLIVRSVSLLIVRSVSLLIVRSVSLLIVRSVGHLWSVPGICRVERQNKTSAQVVGHLVVRYVGPLVVRLVGHFVVRYVGHLVVRSHGCSVSWSLGCSVQRSARVILRRFINSFGYLASEWDEGDNAGEMSPGSNTDDNLLYKSGDIKDWIRS